MGFELQIFSEEKKKFPSQPQALLFFIQGFEPLLSLKFSVIPNFSLYKIFNVNSIWSNTRFVHSWKKLLDRSTMRWKKQQQRRWRRTNTNANMMPASHPIIAYFTSFRSYKTNKQRKNTLASHKHSRKRIKAVKS